MRKWELALALTGAVTFSAKLAGAAPNKMNNESCSRRVIEAFLGEETGVDTLPANHEALPRGSAILVPAEELDESGIRAKILAVVGGATTAGPQWDPSPASVALALRNSVRLAAKSGFSKVAVGFLARGHFLKLMNASKLELADAIVSALGESLPATGVKVVLVVSGTAEQHYFRKLVTDRQVDHVEVVIGSLRDGQSHGCPVIVESVGMERDAEEGA